MAKFIKCSCENTKYRNITQQNSPINIELVTQVLKTQEKYYPDNEGTAAIHFAGIDRKWVYSKEETLQRDADYDRIVNNEF